MHLLYDQTSARAGKKTLDALKEIAEANGSPHLAYPTIHIAGTNGKGTVAWKLAKALHASGYRTGLYTSPHIDRPEERIQVDFIEIPSVLPFREKYPDLNFFELMTFSAFDYFQQQKVDIAVIETGLGGRLDPTNIVDPIVSVITSIGLDHTDILGDSPEKIAREKAGIIKRNIPVVVGPSVPLDAVLPIAQTMNSPLIPIPIRTNNELINREIVNAVLQMIQDTFPISTKQPVDSLPPGRREIYPLPGNRNMVLDGAHNESAFLFLLQTLAAPPQVMILGFSDKKRAAGFFSALSSSTAGLILPVFKSERLLSPCEFLPFIPKGMDVVLNLTADQAVEEALKRKGDVLAAGSFYLIGEVRKALEKNGIFR